MNFASSSMPNPPPITNWTVRNERFRGFGLSHPVNCNLRKDRRQRPVRLSRAPSKFTALFINSLSLSGASTCENKRAPHLFGGCYARCPYLPVPLRFDVCGLLLAPSLTLNYDQHRCQNDHQPTPRPEFCSIQRSHYHLDRLIYQPFPDESATFQTPPVPE